MKTHQFKTSDSKASNFIVIAYVLLIALSILLGKAASAQAPAEVPMDPETFGQEVFAAIQADDFGMMEQFLPREEDMADFVSIERPDATPAEIEELKPKMTEFIEERKAETRQNFDQLHTEADSLGMNWKTATLERVDYRVTKRGNYIRGNIQLIVHFENGNDYQFELDDCFRISRGWIIGDDIRVSSARDRY